MAIRQAIREEWEQFSGDPPGERFERRYHRLRGRGALGTALRILGGLVLLAIGIVLLFIPGPGTLVIVAAIGLAAGDSLRLSRLLDRGEPPARRLIARVVGGWRGMRAGTRAAIVAAAGVGVLALGYGAWSLWAG